MLTWSSHLAVGTVYSVHSMYIVQCTLMVVVVGVVGGVLVQLYERPTCPVDLVVLVRSKLEADGVPVKEIRLNGSGTFNKIP